MNFRLFLLIFAIILLSGINSSFSIDTSHSKSQTKLEKSEIKTEHLVETKILYDEIYDIDISEGHYKVSVEILMKWADEKTSDFYTTFGDEIIHGPKLEKYLEKIWYPEFFVSNAENPRTTHYKTLNVYENKFELFERFEADLSIDAEMPRYPFGNLDLFLDIASFSGNKSKMVFYPDNIEIGHHDAHHKIVKGNWKVTDTLLEEQGRSSLNHGGKEKFSYLISHVNVKHDFIDSIQKILFPIFAIVFISLLLNYFYPSGNYDIFNWRIGGQLTLFLTIPALKFSLGGALPSTHYLNFTDALFIWATFVVTFNLLIGLISHYKMAEEGGNTNRGLERIFRTASPLFAAGAFAVLYFYIFVDAHPY